MSYRSWVYSAVIQHLLFQIDSQSFERSTHISQNNWIGSVHVHFRNLRHDTEASFVDPVQFPERANCFNPWQPKVFGVKFSFREIKTILFH